jgi:hypothetical protein
LQVVEGIPWQITSLMLVHTLRHPGNEVREIYGRSSRAVIGPSIYQSRRDLRAGASGYAKRIREEKRIRFAYRRLADTRRVKARSASALGSHAADTRRESARIRSLRVSKASDMRRCNGVPLQRTREGNGEMDGECYAKTGRSRRSEGEEDKAILLITGRLGLAL